MSPWISLSKLTQPLRTGSRKKSHLIAKSYLFVNRTLPLVWEPSYFSNSRAASPVFKHSPHIDTVVYELYYCDLISKNKRNEELYSLSSLPVAFIHLIYYIIMYIWVNQKTNGDQTNQHSSARRMCKQNKSLESMRLENITIFISIHMNLSKNTLEQIDDLKQ